MWWGGACLKRHAGLERRSVVFGSARFRCGGAGVLSGIKAVGGGDDGAFVLGVNLRGEIRICR